MQTVRGAGLKDKRGPTGYTVAFSMGGCSHFCDCQDALGPGFQNVQEERTGNLGTKTGYCGSEHNKSYIRTDVL